ncbi:FAD-dependent oxidoreductase [Candidatus Woesearchaeota archaeon]|nr:FAD-dependent oxidoreductase [Candidatus Woesearchaeota archaeon]
MQATIKAKREVAVDTLRVEFHVENRPEFKPGQFINLAIPKLKHHDERGNSRFFSIVNPPYEEGITITTRLTGSGFKRTLQEMGIGDRVEIAAIMGSFMLPTDNAVPIVMIAGGIGITPFMSMIKHVLHEKTKHTITLIYSNRNKESAAYLDELQLLSAQNPKFELIATMTKDEAWLGVKGFVDSDFIRQHISDHKNKLFMVVGTPIMMEAVKASLEQLNIAKNNIMTEGFSGY